MPNPIVRALNEVAWAVIPKRAKQNLMLAYLAEHSGEFEDEGEGWLKLGGTSPIRELDEATRQQLIQLSYYYWRNDPVMARAVTLTRDYVMGRGVTWHAPNTETNAIIRRFWDSPNNKCLTRATGQWELMERIILAGEVFLVFFVNKLTGEITVRVLEPEEITQVIPRDDDKMVTTYYERTASQAIYNWDGHTFGAAAQEKNYYPDWEWPDLQHSTVESQGTYVCIHHIKTNSHGMRGVPVYGRIIQWVRSYKGFMEDRLTLTLAAATLAFKQKIKGSVDAVRRLASQWANVSFLRRYRVAGGGQELGPENAAGSRVLVENEAANLEQFQVNTNAANAYLDGRMIRQQMAAGTGITEPNLMGDPSVGNLASQVQMEGPMLKTFESWQQFWHDELVDVMNFVVDISDVWGDKRPGQDRKVEIDFPPIVTKDLPVVIGAVSALITAQTAAGQQFIGLRRLATYILQAFGENDIDAALKEINFDTQTPKPVPTPANQEQKVQAAIEALRLAVGEL
jgi:hypothetical protein